MRAGQSGSAHESGHPHADHVRRQVEYRADRSGEWWRLVTAGFLHGGLMHILMNSWVLFDLGAQVEEMYGSSRMLVIYFVSTRGRLLSQHAVEPGPSVGASAGLFGLIGAMIALGVRHRNALGDSHPRHVHPLGRSTD